MAYKQSKLRHTDVRFAFVIEVHQCACRITSPYV